MVKFNMYNVATLLERLYVIDDDGKHYPLYTENVSVEDVLDKEASDFFNRILNSLPPRKKEENER